MTRRQRVVGIIAGVALCLVNGAVCMAGGEEHFAVVSVKPVDPAMGMFTPRRTGPASIDTTDTLKTLIGLAFDLEPWQIIGGPAWIATRIYHVAGRTETPVTPDQIHAMIGTMLADRFRLVFHKGTQSMAVYVLTVDRKGPRLNASKPGTARDGLGAIQKVSNGVFTRGASMALFARFLTIDLAKPVLNQTHLDGIYDMRLKYDEVSPGATSPADPIASLPTALHDLGLRLQSRRMPVPVLIVDGAAFPTAD